MRRQDEKRLPEFIGKWPPDALESYEERAAIMEYDGGLSRWEAQEKAQDEIRCEYDEQKQLTL